MSITQIEGKIKSLQSEIEWLNKSIESETKTEARYLASINRTRKSISKNTSAASLRSKERSIANDQDKIGKSQKKQSELKEKLGKKKAELSKQQALLQKEQNKAFQNMEKQQRLAMEQQQQAISEMLIKGEPTHLQEKECDFFISHASEDKEAVAQPLADALIARGARVWFDKYSMTVGDSLRQSIDEGLAHSRFGIVILSEIYFKKFWTGKELNGLFAKQEDGKVILPVWHNISKDVVKKYSPMLADMLALKTSDYTIDEIADQFITLIK